MEDNKRRDYAGTPPPAAMESTTMASEQTTSSRRRLKRKSASVNTSGGSSASQTTSSKRQAREKPPPVPIHMNGPCTRARVQPNNNNYYYRGEDEAVGVQVKSEAEAKARGEAEEMMKMSRARENWEALEAKIEAEYDVMIRSRGSTVHVVPVHAGWFSWTKIHPVEEMMLPSFFSGKSESRTPEIYMETRNWIIKKFHHDPNTQIELKHLSELTLGEPDGRQEVMEFLDYWGLINYHPTPDNKPAAMAVDGDANSDEAGKTDNLVEKLFKFETVQSCTPVLLKMNMAMPAVSSGLFPESVAADELVKSEGPAVEYHCNFCSADCSRKRYHCQKQADFDLCADCFNNGKFGSNMSPSDFILMEPAEAGGATGGNWTDQETLLLLEAIELFRDNWSEIAEHVATKTKAQCILHFIEMPIEDAFFNQDDENNAAPKENGLPVSSSTENPAPKADKDGDALKDVPEKIENESDKSDNQEKKDDETGDQETKGDKTDDQESSCPMEISKPDEVNESDKSPEVNESFALKALKEAFEAVGSLPSPGEKFSFAEAGNPVMTLAAFLVRLVDPNTATASVRSILKCLSGNYSGEQLAARHSFRLEDPPDDKKNLADSDGAATEAIEHDAQNDKDEHIKKQNEETPGSVADGCSLHNDDGDKRKDHDEKKDSAAEDQKPVASTSGDHADRSDTVKEADTMATEEEARMASTNEPSNSELEKAPKDTEESVVLTSHTELHTNSVKESEDGASVMEPLQSKGTLKIEDTISIPEKENGLLVTSISEKETGDGEGKGCDGEKKEHPVTHNDLDVDKLKRAAVTALSAAAVKAKLLADQEEDQILQLSTFLVERQLYKLETKLASFNDMENVVMRVKEQLERSKQRLFQERAHIIATRFGMLGQGRPNSQMLPPNKAGVNFPNSGPRPFMGMNSLRPPFARPIMTTNSAASTFTPPSASGNAMQANIDKFSSAGMK